MTTKSLHQLLVTCVGGGSWPTPEIRRCTDMCHTADQDPDIGRFSTLNRISQKKLWVRGSLLTTSLSCLRLFAH